MGDGNIIDLGEIRDRPAVVMRKRNVLKECQHPRFTIWDPEPIIVCSVCEQVVDPYWVLRRMAGGFLRTYWKIKELKKLEEKREARNLKARERRAKKRGGTK